MTPTAADPSPACPPIPAAPRSGAPAAPAGRRPRWRDRSFDPFSRSLDRAVALLTIACAASLLWQSHGAPSSSARSLDPIIVIETGGR